MIQVTVNIQIDRPPAEVFAYIANFENNPKWQSGMVSARFTSTGPLSSGSTYEQEARFLGRPVFSSFEVIAYEPGQCIKITTVSGSFPITVTRSVQPNGSGSDVTAVIEGDASGFFRLAEPLLEAFVRRSVEGDYRRLKTLLEAQGLSQPV